jgi:nucleoside-diphosphate-sugar epimerase
MQGSAFNMRTVLITGGAGFFGSILAKMLLQRGCRCISLDVHPHDYSSENLVALKADIRDRIAVLPIFQKYQPESVLHCAAVMAHGREGRAFLWSSNVEGTRNIAEVAKQTGVRQLLFLSTNCLWTKDLGHPIREDEPPAPVEIYGKSKLEGERILEQYAGTFRLSILRCPAIIDEGRLGLLSILFEFIDEGRKIWVVGHGRNRYQWIHGGDAAEACMRLLDDGHQGLFHAGSDNPQPLGEIYQHVIDHACSSSRIISVPKTIAIPAMRTAYKLGLSPLPSYFYKMIAEDFQFDTTKLKTTTGWQPSTSNEQMLLRAYNYYRQNKSEILARRGASAHRRPSRMGIIRLLKWVS